MSEAETQATLPAVVDAAVGQLPEGWRLKFAKALLKVIGVTTVPEVALRIGDTIDTIEGRRVVSHALAQEAAERLKKDPAAIERAIHRFYAAESEKQDNLESIAALAAGEQNRTANEQIADDDISDDWRRKFVNLAGDVSDPEMQKTWARILSGEIVRPGSFSVATLRAVSELSQKEAETFTRLCSSRFQDAAYRSKSYNWKNSPGLDELQFLAEAGLIAANHDTIAKIATPDERGRYAIFDQTHGIIAYSPTFRGRIQIPIIPLSRIGSELLPLVQEVNEAVIIRKIAEECVLPHFEGPDAYVLTGRIIDQVGRRFIDPDRFLLGDRSILARIP